LAKDAKAAVTWLAPSDVSPAGSGWSDVDVSASVPAGATGGFLHIIDNSFSYGNYGLRQIVQVLL